MFFCVYVFWVQFWPVPLDFSSPFSTLLKSQIELYLFIFLFYFIFFELYLNKAFSQLSLQVIKYAVYRSV